MKRGVLLGWGGFGAPNGRSPAKFDHSLLFTFLLRHPRATLPHGRPSPRPNPEAALLQFSQIPADLLVKSIHRVHAGEIWLDNRMTAEVMKAFSKSSESGPRREKPLLSDREKEIVQLVAQGFRNKEIGEKLFISEQTVKNHLHNIFDKLGVSDRLELALYAIHHRLIDQSA